MSIRLCTSMGSASAGRARVVAWLEGVYSDRELATQASSSGRRGDVRHAASDRYCRLSNSSNTATATATTKTNSNGGG